MRHLATALLSSLAAVLLWAALTPVPQETKRPPAADVPLTWSSPHLTRNTNSQHRVWKDPVDTESVSSPEQRPSVPHAPSGWATLHVEDGDGYPVEDLWISWVCEGAAGKSPEIRAPISSGEHIDGVGDCYFQAVDDDGAPYSEDLPVTLESGEHLDIWLVVDEA